MRLLNEQEDFDEAWQKLGSLSGGLAFNVGANHGQAARLLAKGFTRVVAYEPCEESFRELERTVPDNVHPVPVAVSDHAGVVTLVESERAIDTGMLTTISMWEDRQIGTRDVECTTLSAEAVLFGAPDLVQMDVEGHEIAALEGGVGMINEHHPDLFIEIHAHEHAARIVAMFPGYVWETFRWPGTRPESVLWNHYWIYGAWHDGDNESP